MFGVEYIWDAVIWIIALLLSGRTWDSKRKELSNFFVKIVLVVLFLGAALLFTANRHNLLFFAPASEGAEQMLTGVGRGVEKWRSALPSLWQFILAGTILVVFYFLFKKARLPKEWSAEKDENGQIVKEPAVRLVGLVSCVLVGLSLALVVCWPKVWYFGLAMVIGLALDLVYIVPYLHVYTVFFLQKPVRFWQPGLHVFLPSWLPKNVFDIWNLARERIEATAFSGQLPTADSKVTSTGSNGSDGSFSATISLENWLVFWTNYLPEIFIRYSRTDRAQLKTIVFNIVEAFEAEMLLTMNFEAAREKKDYFFSTTDLRQAADLQGMLPEFKSLEGKGASDAEWLRFANKVFAYNSSKLEPYKRFLALRSRVMHLVGVYLDDIKVKDRNSTDEIEAAINAVTLAVLKRQEAEISIRTGEAEGEARSKRETEALKGVLALIQQGNNATALAVWTDYQRSVNNRNISVGGVDIAGLLAQLAKKSSS